MATRSDPQAFPVAASAEGDTEVIPAAPAGFAWEVVGLSLSAANTVTAGFKIGTGTVAAGRLAAGPPWVMPPGAWGFPLREAKAVSLNLSGAVAVSGHVTARLVPFPNYARPVLLAFGEQLAFDFDPLIHE